MKRDLPVDALNKIWEKTHWSKTYLKERIERLNKYANDPDKKSRKEDQYCVNCYYGDWIGGSVMTSRACDLCLENMNFPSTHTNKVCKKCATKHFLCRHCMADQDLKIRRAK